MGALKNLDLKNKVIFLSFFITTSFVFVFALLYYMLDLRDNIDACVGIGFILLLIFNIFFVTFIHDLILKDIEVLRGKTEKMKKGNLHENFKTTRKDEIGEVFNNFEQISNNQNEILKQVKTSTEKIDESSTNIKLLIIENQDVIKELSTNISLVNEGTTIQIRGIENMEFSIEEMAAGISRINGAITEVADNANRSVAEAKKGNSALERVVIRMNEIQQTSEDSVETIRVLGEQIKEIQKIVDVIRSISSRTNLLALNATIEAERAGENGEGFVVVADEIKDLAIKATESTVKIEKIARNIMEKKEKSIEEIEHSAKEIRSGILVLNEASQAFNKIMHSTGDIGNQLNELSSSSEQLSSNTHQIIESVEKLGKITREYLKNTSNIETVVEQQENSIRKLAGSIDSLNVMTEEMNVFLSKFKK